MGMVTLESLFAAPPRHLGAENPVFRGIVSPQGETGEKIGVTDQFLENAAEYHRRYSDVGHFRQLIDRALAGLGDIGDPEVILDIGSGSGNSVIPLLDRFPQAFVLATDISPQLLAILRDYLEARPQYAGRYALACMDATNNRFRAGVFDLAVGAAILHHLIEPQRVVQVCERALKPGGAAIFFEPFANRRPASSNWGASPSTTTRARATRAIRYSSASTTSGCSRAVTSSPPRPAKHGPARRSSRSTRDPCRSPTRLA